MPPVGFEPTVSAGERPQTYVLDRAATGTGTVAPNGVNFVILASYLRQVIASLVTIRIHKFLALRN